MSLQINLQENGANDGNPENTWSFESPWITINYGNGTFIDKVCVYQGYDWENHQETHLYIGLNNELTAILGKKK